MRNKYMLAVIIFDAFVRNFQILFLNFNLNINAIQKMEYRRQIFQAFYILGLLLKHYNIITEINLNIEIDVKFFIKVTSFFKRNTIFLNIQSMCQCYFMHTK